MEEEENFNFRPHGCALCKNLLDVREPCCCLHESANMTEVTEPRLLKRCNLKKGDRLCPTHYDKVKSGLIFGVAQSGCCAPFHIDTPDGNRLRPVPRTWRHLFDVSNIRERYLPFLQICNRCYKITLDLVLRGETNDEKEAWDLSPTSPTSPLSSRSYTSPRRWLSSFTLHANDSSTSGSSLSSSTTRLSSASSGYLLSLYETHREKLGHPRAIPDSIKRYFKYGQSSPTLSGGKTPIFQHRRSFESVDSSEKSADEDDRRDKKLNISSSLMADLTKRISNKQLLASGKIQIEPKYQSSSPKLSLNFNSATLPSSARRACKLSIASSGSNSVLDNRTSSESIRSDSSSDLGSEWESISLSLFSDLDSEKDEKKISTPNYTNKETTPDEITQEASIKSIASNESIFADDKSIGCRKPMSINIQFIVNPNLKHSRLTNQVEMCKSYDSFSTSTDELLARAENFEVLELLSSSSSSNSEIFDRSEDIDSYNTSDCMSETSVDRNFINNEILVSNCLAQTFDDICEKLLNSGLFQHENISDLLRQIDQTNLDIIHVFAGTLAQCVITFAMQDVAKQIAYEKKSLEPVNTNSLLRSEICNLDDHLIDGYSVSSDLISVASVTDFADLHAEKILLEVLTNASDHSQKQLPERHTSELSLTTCAAQRLKLRKSDEDSQGNICILGSGKTVIKWLEKKGCYRSVFSVRFKERCGYGNRPNNMESRTDIDGPNADNALASEVQREDPVALKPSGFHSVECVVDDLIPITRSLSTSFIDNSNATPLAFNAPYLMRASSHNSFFTLTCQPSTNAENLDEQFIAIPLHRIKNSDRESGVFLSTSTTERMSSEDGDLLNPNGVDVSDDLSAFEIVSLSSGETDFSSSSTLDDCDTFEAELLEQSKISDRPHFVSHKSRIDDINESIPRPASVPFELKPELKPPTLHEDEEDDKSLESFSANTIENESQYEESHYEDAASTTEAKNKDTVEDSTENKTDNDKEEKLPDEYPRKKKISVIGRRDTKSFDWYIGEDLSEQRRSTQLLKALSNAALFTTHTQKKRREIRTRKTDEDPEDDNVSDVLSHVLQEYTPKLFLRRSRDEETESVGRNPKTVIRIVAVVGLIGSLFFAGWKYYT